MLVYTRLLLLPEELVLLCASVEKEDWGVVSVEQWGIIASVASFLGHQRRGEGGGSPH